MPPWGLIIGNSDLPHYRVAGVYTILGEFASGKVLYFPYNISRGVDFDDRKGPAAHINGVKTKDQQRVAIVQPMYDRAAIRKDIRVIAELPDFSGSHTTEV